MFLTSHTLFLMRTAAVLKLLAAPTATAAPSEVPAIASPSVVPVVIWRAIATLPFALPVGNG